MVRGSNYTLLRNYSDLEEMGCGNIVLNTNQHFHILPNDIIAACIISDIDNDVPIQPLFVTSRVGDDAYEMLVKSECLDGELVSIDTNQLRFITRRQLHLNATIGKKVIS